jgi:hypothetical protein
VEAEAIVERAGIGDGVLAGIGVGISAKVGTAGDGCLGRSTTATWSKIVGKVYGIGQEIGINKRASPCALILDVNCEVSWSLAGKDSSSNITCLDKYALFVTGSVILKA